ncbi:hypothetical protein D3C73_823730 [compost metagenome]
METHDRRQAILALSFFGDQPVASLDLVARSAERDLALMGIAEILGVTVVPGTQPVIAVFVVPALDIDL